ncbi:carbohydrate kinase family protein [Salinibacterium sp. NG253]|uniref:carbohydrate kinase family protein n=1 Tax=Salinibacterium sp. NG253 TaxID=2792039 RepID=UPI0018CFDEF9|nr:carbohydrate kinase family protein [Salinibacterium sp. NG253]MBH0115259.1 carbohydrate kinase family protein [Salinibacterium sp. NG253]
MPNRILISGPVSWNSIVYLDHLPEPRPHMQFALEDFETVGGTSAGKALHLAGLGRRVSCLTAAGDDAASIRLRAVLESAGIELQCVPVPGASERHLNLMTRAGERVSLYLSTPAFVEPDVAQFRALAEGAEALVMDLSETSRALLPEAVASGIPIWTDLHDYDGRSDFHEPFVQAASHLFMNADGMPDPLPFMRDRVNAGATVVVCTLGAEGAMALDADGLHRVDAVPAEIRDTNGAGDAFFAGFLHATLSGSDTDGALATAASQAVVALESKHLHPCVENALG